MKVSELRDKLDIFIDHGHGDDEVVIHCKEVSMGPHAAESLKGVWVGFDWDQGRVLIEPESPLVHYGTGRDDPMTAVHITYHNDYHGKITPPPHCPLCGAQLHKTDRYCPKCGQMLDMKCLKEVTI